jgi:RNA polymerase sigma factor (sigma-70 family)
VPGTQLRIQGASERGRPRSLRELDDGELLVAFVRKCRDDAFDELVRRHGPLVWGVCRRILQHDQDTEDAFQATFLVLARKASSISKKHCLAGWLYRVAYRIALRARANRARRKAQETRPENGARPSAHEPTGREISGMVEEEVQRLPEKYRLPVLLCYLQGHTNEEAARALRCPTGTVKVRLLRAREILRKRLLRRGIGLSVAAALAAWPGAAHAAAPELLRAQTVRACSEVAGGMPPAATGLSDAAVALAEGWFRRLALAKIKLSAAVLLVIGLLVGTDHLLQKARGAGPERDVTPGRQLDVPTTPSPRSLDLVVREEQRRSDMPLPAN